MRAVSSVRRRITWYASCSLIGRGTTRHDKAAKAPANYHNQFYCRNGSSSQGSKIFCNRMQLAPKTLLRPIPKFVFKTRNMASSTFGPSSNVEEFGRVLKSSKRVLALCGAGLSAASGLDTFRGAGGMWRNREATSLATPEAFARDPGLVWLFYSYRRHKSLHAKPNPGHYALVELSKRMPGFITLTQNVDGLSQRANHPREQLKLLHGSLFDIKCFNCKHIEHNNFDDPFHPVLAITSPVDDRLAPSANTVQAKAAYMDPNVDTATINPADLPHCPSCKTGLLRPGVVWFGEALPEETLKEIDDWIDEGKVDLIMVIGTTAQVYPAAGYVTQARARGARVAVINMDGGDLGSTGSLRNGDFLFEGDAAKILPEILRPVIGEPEA